MIHICEESEVLFVNKGIVGIGFIVFLEGGVVRIGVFGGA
jgi:hypothetical protein